LSLDDRILGVTTPIKVIFESDDDAGTGFFYRQLDKAERQGDWVKTKDTWLVTNKHIVTKRHIKWYNMACSLSFRVRMRTSNGLTWNTVTLGKDKLLERTLFHRNKAVDIAIIRISDVISEFLVKSSESNYYLNDFGVTSIGVQVIR
jgi:hypothetical protein